MTMKALGFLSNVVVIFKGRNFNCGGHFQGKEFQSKKSFENKLSYMSRVTTKNWFLMIIVYISCRSLYLN
jgi:hypothetical protein